MHRASFITRITIGLGCGVLAVAGIAANGHARATRVAVENLPLIGTGVQGTAFVRTCPDDHVLTGFRYRSGLLLDGISIRCRPIRSDGTLGTEVLVGTQAGGNGGTLANKSCSANQVIVSQKGISGVGIVALSYFCVRWSATSKAWFGSGDVLGLVAAPASAASHTCSSSTQPATGIRGRHGMIIDGIGLICDTP